MADYDDLLTVLLAAPTERAHAWYKSLTGHPFLDVLSYSADLADLQHKLEETAPEVLILDADLFDGPDALRAMLEPIQGVLVFLVLPPQAGQEQIDSALSNACVAGGWVGDVKLAEIAGDIRQAALQARSIAGPAPVRSPAPIRPASPSPASAIPAGHAPSPDGGGRVVAFWSGSSGGTGCTTLSLALSALAASRSVGTILLALSEPSVSTYLHLDRVPNVASFFTARGDRLAAATQRIGWGAQNGRASMHVVLGPARPSEGVIEPDRLSLLIEAACAAYALVVIDVPSLPPGGNPWTMVPLQHATDIVLVMAPTVMGISATVEALVTLDTIGASGSVHLVLNQRFPSGAFGSRDFRAGIEAVWQPCPEAFRIGFIADLPASMNRGEIPDGDILGDGLESLGALAGLPAPPASTGGGARGFSLGKLRITVQA